jgi:hypothetical protein
MGCCCRDCPATTVRYRHFFHVLDWHTRLVLATTRLFRAATRRAAACHDSRGTAGPNRREQPQALMAFDRQRGVVTYLIGANPQLRRGQRRSAGSGWQRVFNKLLDDRRLCVWAVMIYLEPLPNDSGAPSKANKRRGIAGAIVLCLNCDIVVQECVLHQPGAATLLPRKRSPWRVWIVLRADPSSLSCRARRVTRSVGRKRTRRNEWKRNCKH